ncbi:hypothetical protein I4F81_011146 [Pyropia yezoensis]|uniref:Uncharacterized protein n=1 Tax=Pyropia yezoensis TaxID=2788 RepID=A0ACC3CFX0_PYRYE|nr:hypothetical protein I4F81_011146 [Neopyropia yezoensis]
MTDAFGDDDFFKDYPPTSTGAAAPLNAGASAPAVGVPDDADHAARLEERATREATVVAERRAAATEALATLHAKWGDRCARNAEGNKEFEGTFLRERDGLIAQFSKPGEPPAWHVVPSLVDMSGKYKEGARDTSRMRSVLMKMKTK